MSRNMLAADLHFGHRSILRYRTNFTTIEQHDATIMANMTSTLTKHDVLWLLGDCFFDDASYDLLRQLRSLVSSIKFVPGNHDTDNSQRHKLFIAAIKEGLFDEVHAVKKHKGIWLSHVPIHPAELYGKRCVHGHTHSKLVEPYSDYVCVSVDHSGYKPVNLQHIIDGSYQPMPFSIINATHWAVNTASAIVECTSSAGNATIVFFNFKRPFVVLPDTTRTLTEAEATSALTMLQQTHQLELPFVNIGKLYTFK